jgi:hypothetical protein
MRFVPSAYSDAAAVTTLDARPQSVQDAQDIASGISEASQVAAQLISSGADVARAASDAKLAAWQKKAAKKAKKKQKAATTAPMPALPATRAPAPVAAPQTDWAKWGLIGMGALVVGVLGFVLVSRLRSSGDDDSKAKKNPVARKPFIRVPPPRRRVPKVIDIEAEEVEEVEPEPVEQGDDYGDDYGDAEGEE